MTEGDILGVDLQLDPLPGDTSLFADSYYDSPIAFRDEATAVLNPAMPYDEVSIKQTVFSNFADKLPMPVVSSLHPDQVEFLAGKPELANLTDEEQRRFIAPLLFSGTLKPTDQQSAELKSFSDSIYEANRVKTTQTRLAAAVPAIGLAPDVTAQLQAAAPSLAPAAVGLSDTVTEVLKSAARDGLLATPAADAVIDLAKQAFGTSPVTTPQAPSRSVSTTYDRLITDLATSAGVDPQLVKAVVGVESSGNPNAQTGSYKGLMQLSDKEFAKYGGAGGNIFDPQQNLKAGIAALRDNIADYRQRTGKEPTAADIYLMHQQGRGGHAAHTANPDAPAWQNMFSTSEGQSKGANWAKQAIWGNIANQDRQKYFPGGVESVTSKAFIQYWSDKIAGRTGASAAAMDKPFAYTSKFYTDTDLRNDRFGKSNPMDPRVMQALDRVTEILGGNKLPIASGYRSPEYNNQVSFTKFTGPHTDGRAVDINTTGMSDQQKQALIKTAVQQGFTQVGTYDNNSIHLGVANATGKGPGGLQVWHGRGGGFDNMPPWAQAAINEGLAGTGAVAATPAASRQAASEVAAQRIARSVVRGPRGSTGTTETGNVTPISPVVFSVDVAPTLGASEGGTSIVDIIKGVATKVVRPQGVNTALAAKDIQTAQSRLDKFDVPLPLPRPEEADHVAMPRPRPSDAPAVDPQFALNLNKPFGEIKAAYPEGEGRERTVTQKLGDTIADAIIAGGGDTKRAGDVGRRIANLPSLSVAGKALMTIGDIKVEASEALKHDSPVEAAKAVVSAGSLLIHPHHIPPAMSAQGITQGKKAVKDAIKPGSDEAIQQSFERTVHPEQAAEARVNSAKSIAAAVTGRRKLRDEPANIDATQRPVWTDEKTGEKYTTKSINVEVDGKEVLLPTVDAKTGRVMSVDEAVDHYKKTGEHLGKYSTPEAAETAGKELSKKLGDNMFAEEQRAKVLLHSDPSEQARAIASAITGRRRMRPAKEEENPGAAITRQIMQVNAEEFVRKEREDTPAPIRALKDVGRAAASVTMPFNPDVFNQANAFTFAVKEAVRKGSRKDAEHDYQTSLAYHRAQDKLADEEAPYALGAVKLASGLKVGMSALGKLTPAIGPGESFTAAVSRAASKIMPARSAERTAKIVTGMTGGAATGGTWGTVNQIGAENPEFIKGGVMGAALGSSIGGTVQALAKDGAGLIPALIAGPGAKNAPTKSYDDANKLYTVGKAAGNKEIELRDEIWKQTGLYAWGPEGKPTFGHALTNKTNAGELADFTPSFKSLYKSPEPMSPEAWAGKYDTLGKVAKVPEAWEAAYPGISKTPVKWLTPRDMEQGAAAAYKPGSGTILLPRPGVLSARTLDKVKAPKFDLVMHELNHAVRMSGGENSGAGNRSPHVLAAAKKRGEELGLPELQKTYNTELQSYYTVIAKKIAAAPYKGETIDERVLKFSYGTDGSAVMQASKAVEQVEDVASKYAYETYRRTSGEAIARFEQELWKMDKKGVAADSPLRAPSEIDIPPKYQIHVDENPTTVPLSFSAGSFHIAKSDFAPSYAPKTEVLVNPKMGEVIAQARADADKSVRISVGKGGHILSAPASETIHGVMQGEAVDRGAKAFKGDVKQLSFQLQGGKLTPITLDPRYSDTTVKASDLFKNMPKTLPDDMRLSAEKPSTGFSFRAGDKDVGVLMNPSERDLIGMAKDDAFGRVRVLIGKNNSLAAAPASDVVHEEVRRALVNQGASDFERAGYQIWQAKGGKLFAYDDRTNSVVPESLVNVRDTLSRASRGEASARADQKAPTATDIAYKLFRKKGDDLHPLFIDKNKPVPVGEWVDATNNPTKGFAERPGWHAGTLPMAPHLRTKEGMRAPDRVWAEVSMPADKNWQAVADASPTKDVRGEVPVGGSYNFPTSKMQGGAWKIGGAMKVDRVLSNEDVGNILRKAGHADQIAAETRGEIKFSIAPPKDKNKPLPDGGKPNEPTHFRVEEAPGGAVRYSMEQPVTTTGTKSAKQIAEMIVSPQLVVDKTIAQGGYTVQPITGHEPTSGLMIGKYANTDKRNTVVDNAQFVAKVVTDSFKKNKAGFKNEDNYLGTWRNTEDGKTYLDVSKRFEPDDVRSATKYGEKTGQLAGWDIGKSQPVPIGNYKQFIESEEFTTRLTEMRAVGAQQRANSPNQKPWWPIAGSSYERIYGKDLLPQVSGFTATTAPMTDVRHNIQIASEYIRRQIAGEPIVQPDWRMPAGGMTYKEGIQMPMEKGRTANLIKASQGKLKELQRDKVADEAQALMGDKDAMVLDRWHMRLAEKPSAGVYAGTQEGQLSGEAYTDLHKALMKRARASGQNPDQYSADVWVGIRDTVRASNNLYGQPFKGSAVGDTGAPYHQQIDELISDKAKHLGITTTELEARLRKGSANLMSFVLAAPIGLHLLRGAGGGAQPENERKRKPAQIQAQ